MNERTTKVLVVVALSSCLMCGCRKQTNSVVMPTTVPQVPVVEQPVVSEAPATRPAWATAFVTADELLGQTKEVVVAKLGPPTDTFNIANEYIYKTEDYRLFLSFDSKQQLSSAELKFEHAYNAPNAGDAWKAIASSATPESFMINDSLVKDQIAQSGSASGRWAIALNGKVASGRLVQLNCSSTTPLLWGKRTFNTKTDRYTVSELEPDPFADWRAMAVQKVMTGKHETSDMVYWGSDHPLTIKDPQPGD